MKIAIDVAADVRAMLLIKLKLTHNENSTEMVTNSYQMIDFSLPHIFIKNYFIFFSALARSFIDIIASSLQHLLGTRGAFAHLSSGKISLSLFRHPWRYHFSPCCSERKKKEKLLKKR